MDNNTYYMNIALAVRKKANCMGRKVGAILVKESRVISSGYNGTPEGIINCTDGGCIRCRDKKTYQASVGYDVCVHAEQNALITAARFGNPVEGGVIYSTLRPCFDCTKAMLQARIESVYYLHNWQHPLGSLQEQYEILQRQFHGGVNHVDIYDPESDWANNVRKSRTPELTFSG